MTEAIFYAVFFHPAALEALGDPIKPYLSESPYGPHVVCREIDSGGAFFEMTLEGRNAQDQTIEVELMVPTAMVRMVISTHSDEGFGFHHDKDADIKPSSSNRKPAAMAAAPMPGDPPATTQPLPAAAILPELPAKG